MKTIKKGDEVIVIAGADKGTIGIVQQVLAEGEKLIVDGVNKRKKAVKPNPNANEEGGIKTKLMPIHRSNVMLTIAGGKDGSKKRTRVGIRIQEDGQRVRYFKANNELVDVK